MKDAIGRELSIVRVRGTENDVPTEDFIEDIREELSTLRDAPIDSSYGLGYRPFFASLVEKLLPEISDLPVGVENVDGKAIPKKMSDLTEEQRITYLSLMAQKSIEARAKAIREGTEPPEEDAFTMMLRIIFTSMEWGFFACRVMHMEGNSWKSRLSLIDHKKRGTFDAAIQWYMDKYGDVFKELFGDTEE